MLQHYITAKESTQNESSDFVFLVSSFLPADVFFRIYFQKLGPAQFRRLVEIYI